MQTLIGGREGEPSPDVDVDAGADAGAAEPSDQALVREAIDGSARAFEELYRRHAPAAWRVAQAVTRNPDDASDAVAEAFTRVFKALSTGRLTPDLAFRPYLLAATRNAAIDGLRKSGRMRPTDEIERFDEHAPGSGPSERLIVGDDRVKMAEAFAALPERWRSVLWMTEVEEMPAREVAKLLGLSANGVAQLAVRARAGLRDRYLQAHVRNHARPPCVHTVEHLGAYIGGGLAPRDVAKVDQHLASCAECRERVIEVEDVGSTLRRLALPLPAGLGAMALEHFRLDVLSTAADASRRALPAAAAGGLRRAFGVFVGASTVVIGLGGMVFVRPAPSEPRPVARPARIATAIAPDPSVPPAPPLAPPAASTDPVPTVADPAGSAPQTPVGASAPELPLPPIPAVHVPLPPVSLPVPVEATAGAGVGGVGVGVGVGRCTGVAVGPVTAGCPPATPDGTGMQVDAAGVINLDVP